MPKQGGEVCVGRVPAAAVSRGRGKADDGARVSAVDVETVVLGGGISGMVAAAVLLAQGRGPLLLLEPYGRLGGNHIDVSIGPYTFDIGSFFFSRTSPFFNHFPRLLPEYLPVDYTIARITPRGLVASYPFSLRHDIVDRGPLEWARIAFSVGRARLTIDPDHSAEAFIDYWLGRRFADISGLRGFLHRFYGADPRLIEAAFARKRMEWVSSNARLGALLKRLVTGRHAQGAPQMVRPRVGFGPLYALAAETIQTAGGEIRLGTRPTAVRRTSDGRFIVKIPGETIRTGAVISTIPVLEMLSICGLPPVSGLESRDLVSLFYSFDGRRGFAENVLYNFARDGSWKRLTVHSDFYGTAGGRMFLTVEILASNAPGEPTGLASAFEQHVRRHGLFEGDLRLEGTHVTRSAYPVYIGGATAAASDAIGRLRAFGIASFGRQGGFDYQPTGVVSTRVAERALSPGVSSG